MSVTSRASSVVAFVATALFVGCSMTPSASDYLRISPPYQLASASAADLAALQAFARSDKVKASVRSSSASTVRGLDREGHALVLMFDRSAVSPGFLSGFIDAMVDGKPLRVRIGSFDTTGFQHDGFAGLAWVDDDTVVVIRGPDGLWVTEVARSIITARRQ